MSAAGHPGTALELLFHARFGVLPSVARELEKWRVRAHGMPDPELREQALNSLEHKTFHAEGGALFAGRAPSRRGPLIELIVAYQTLADYLDNLCDRSSADDPRVFRELHRAMTDALELAAEARDYYGGANGTGRDNGYLTALSTACQSRLRPLPHYARLKTTAVTLGSLYAELQELKHGPHAQREPLLLDFWKRSGSLAPHLRWYEFAAATGSTLGLFQLFAVASSPTFDPSAAEAILSVYFPWICPLHILLDYLVDREEDELGGDLNFVAYYRDDDDALERLRFLVDGAKRSLAGRPDAEFHRMIVDGLLGLYLSDGKVGRQPRVHALAKRLLRASPPRVRFFYLGCRLHRGSKASLQPPPVRSA